MTGLQSALASLNESSNSLKTLYFRPPGIFTNALIGKPDITTLLRDADAFENALYQVDAQDRPERKDGTRGVVDQLNDDLDELQLQQLQEEADGGELVQRPSVVIVPREVVVSNDENKGVKNLLSKFNEENEKDYDIDVLCETVSQLLDKYPIDGVREELERLRQRWQSVNLEIMENEETIEKQRRQLSLLRISLNERELRSDDTGERPVRTAAQLIAEEEEEIRRLELQISTEEARDGSQ